MNILGIGINKGREETIPTLIKTIQELGGTKAFAVQKIIATYQKNFSEAQAYVDKFWQA